MLRNKLLPSAAFVLSIACATQVQAATKTDSMAVSMTVTAGCTVTGGSLPFGSQSALQSNVDQQGAFTVTCTNTTPYSIGMDNGMNSSSVNSRKMKGGTNATEFVGYQLYRDAARTMTWGSTSGSNELPGTGNGSAQAMTVYGRVPPQSIGSPGGYTDNVTITVTY